jgi:hypothetical protein
MFAETCRILIGPHQCSVRMNLGVDTLARLVLIGVQSVTSSGVPLAEVTGNLRIVTSDLPHPDMALEQNRLQAFDALVEVRGVFMFEDNLLAQHGAAVPFPGFMRRPSVPLRVRGATYLLGPHEYGLQHDDLTEIKTPVVFMQDSIANHVPWGGETGLRAYQMPDYYLTVHVDTTTRLHPYVDGDPDMPPGTYPDLMVRGTPDAVFAPRRP